MTDITALPASIAASESDLFGPLEPTGPRAGADRGQPMTAIRVLSDVGPVQVGVWECTPGGWSIENRPNTEVVRILRASPTSRTRTARNTSWSPAPWWCCRSAGPGAGTSTRRSASCT